VSTISNQASETVSTSRGRRRKVLVPETWASLAISLIWLAVLLDALFGPDLVASSAGTNFTRIPSAVVLAFFAWLATWAIAKYGFGRPARDGDWRSTGARAEHAISGAVPHGNRKRLLGTVVLIALAACVYERASLRIRAPAGLRGLLGEDPTAPGFRPSHERPRI
jgi:hypothetical protein